MDIDRRLTAVLFFLVLASGISCALDIGSCWDLNESGTTYVLTANVSSAGSCMNVTADNVTLDCAGYTINYSQSTLGYAVNDSGGFDFVTVRNCTIIQEGNSSSSSAIYLHNSENNTVEYNNIITNGSSSNGIYLDSSSSSYITHNTIMTSGQSGSGIDFWDSNSSYITHNTITTSGQLGKGIFLDSSPLNVVTSNEIMTLGQSGDGIHLHDSELTDISYNNVTTLNITSDGVYVESTTSNNITQNTITTFGEYSVGIYLWYTSLNIVDNNNLTTSNNESHGIYLRDNSDSNTISNSRIISESSYAIYLRNQSSLVKPENNLIYNCLLNGSTNSIGGYSGWEDLITYYNTTNQTGTRIYSSGTNIGGNYYTNSSGDGFSDTCPDTNHDGFCDSYYNVTSNSATASSGTNVDYLPLSDDFVAITFTLNSLANNTITSDTTPTFNFTVSGTEVSYNCTLYVNDTSRANNDSVLNGSAAVLTSTALGAGPYNWYVNCSSGGLTNQSETRTLDIGAGLTHCGVLADANTQYNLTQNVSSAGTCFTIAADNITLDGKGYTINYSQTAAGNAVKNTGGYGLLTLNNCVMTQAVSRTYSDAVNLEGGVDNAIISGNVITIIGGYHSEGIYASDGSGLLIDSNEITGGDVDGMILDSVSNSNITNNNITTLDVSIVGYDSVNNRFAGNRLTADSDGIFSQGADGVDFVNNIINAGSYGLNLNGDDNCDITNNTIDSDDTGIYVSGNNCTFSLNEITTNGSSSFGMWIDSPPFITDPCGIFLSNNDIKTYGDDSYGVYYQCNYSSFSSDNITTWGSSSHGLYFDYGHNSNLTYVQVNVNGTDSYGLYLLYSENNTLANSTVESKQGYAVYMDSWTEDYKSKNNGVYNCLLNGSATPVGFDEDLSRNALNHWNTTNQTGVRIYSEGDNIGGNYYTNSSGDGYSDTCPDTDHDGFCDSYYNVTSNSATASSGTNVDYLPLSDGFVAIDFILNSLANNTITSDTTPTFNFTVSGSETVYDCTLYVNDTSRANNDSVLNGTATVLTSTVLGAGTYDWYINCSADGATEQSEIRTLDIGAGLTSCGVLADADTQYNLTQNVSSAGTCFTIAADNITLDGKGYTINYSQSVVGYGVDDGGGFDSLTVRNCTIFQGGTSNNAYALYFNSGAENATIEDNVISTKGQAHALYFNSASKGGTIKDNNITTSGSTAGGVYLYAGSNNTLIEGNRIIISASFRSSIYSTQSSYLSIKDNFLSSNSIAVEIHVASGYGHNNLTGNQITGAESLDGTVSFYGIWDSPTDTYVQDNEINASDGIGIYVEYGTGYQIINNTVYSDPDSCIFMYGSGDLINNTLETNSSGYATAGIFLAGEDKNLIQGNTITANNGISGVEIDTYSNILDNNTITSNGNGAIGVYLYRTLNNTIKNTKIKSEGVGVYLEASNPGQTENNTIYNNLINASIPINFSSDTARNSTNYYNTTEQTGARIHTSGPNIGGNYYTNSSGEGFSDTCPDTDHDGFCDGYYNVTSNSATASAGLNVDYLALSGGYVGIEITLNSPANKTITIDTTPDFNFTVSGSEATYNCTLYVNDTSRANNASVQNGTATVLTSTSLGTGPYSWYVNCTVGGATEQSEVRTLSIGAGLSHCGVLADADTQYNLTQNVSSAGTCFTIAADNITLDGKGYTINYSQSAVGYAVNDSGGYDYLTVRNCTIFQGGNSANSHALHFEDSENNTIEHNWIETNHDAVTDDKCGIYLEATNNTAIEHNTIRTGGDRYNYGIYLYMNSCYNNISYNNLSSSGLGDYSYGVYFNEGSSHNKLSNNDINNSNRAGVCFYHSANDNSIVYNRIDTYDSMGIFLDYETANETISYNNITSIQGSGYWWSVVYADYSDDNVITYNNLHKIGLDNSAAAAILLDVWCSGYNISYNNITAHSQEYVPGISVEDESANNILQGNNIWTNGTKSHGIAFKSNPGDNNDALANTVVTVSDESYGIFLEDAYGGKVLDNNISTNGTYAYGMFLNYDASYNNISGNRINTNGTLAYGMHLDDYPEGNIIADSTITSKQTYAIYVNGSGSYQPLDNTIYNCLLNGSATPVGFYPVSDQNYWNTTNQTGTRIYSPGTNIGGNYYTNSSGDGYSDTCPDTDHDGFCDSWYNVSSNSATASPGLNVDYLALSGGYEASLTCGDLSSANTTYYLTQNVSSAGTCFTILADNVTLDCQGHTINYSQSAVGYAVDDSGGFDSVTVRNCTIFQGGNSASSYGIYFDSAENNTIEDNYIETNDDAVTDYKHGIYLSETRNSEILNNTILTYNDDFNYGISLVSNSDDNHVAGNVINTTGRMSFAIYTENVMGSNISDNIIYTTGDWANGLYLESVSHDNLIYNNDVTANMGGGIHVLFGGYNNIISHNSIFATIDWAVYIDDDSDNTTVTYNSITTNDSDAVGVYSFLSVNNNISYNNITTTGSLNSYGVWLEYGTYIDINHTVEGNIINVSCEDAPGIFISYAGNCVVKNNTIITYANNSYGIWVDADNNQISYNDIITSGSGAHGIDIWYDSDYNQVFNNNISVSGLSSYALHLRGHSDYNNITACILKSEQNYSVRISEDLGYAPENNTVYNCLLNGSSVPVSFENAIAEGKTNYWNTTEQAGTRIYSSGTNIGGNYYTNSSGDGYSDTCPDTDKDGFCDSWYNVSSNSATAATGFNIDYLVLSNEYVNSSVSLCGNLTTANMTYYLTQNVSSAGTCFNVQADNVTLDCAGYAINYSQSAQGYGVNSSGGFDLLTVRNCVIWGGGFNESYGVYLKDSNFSLVENNTITTDPEGSSNNSYGMYLYSCSQNNISLNVVSTYGKYGHGIYLNSYSDQNNISKNMVEIFYDLTAEANGIYLKSDSESNMVYNNTVFSYSENSGCIVLEYGSNNNTVLKNDLTSININTRGIDVYASSYNDLVENTIWTNDSWSSGILFYQSADSNRAWGNVININYSDAAGISFRSSNLNNVSNNTINSDGYGFLFEYSSCYNQIMNSSISAAKNAVYFENLTTNKPENNTIYNCLLNSSSVPVGGSTGWENFENTWNTTNQTGSRIYSSGNWIGGNYYTNSSGTGFSDTCPDTDQDGFCDLYYNVSSNSATASSGTNIDYHPLSGNYSANVSFNITLASPGNESITSDTTPDFGFTVAGSETTYNCTLYLNDTSQANNVSVQNNTLTVLTPAALGEDMYLWYVNCSSGGVMNQSETRALWVDATPPTYSLNSTNSTLAGDLVEHRLRWQDNLNLSGFVFSFDNGTGTFVNDTWNPIAGAASWSNVSKIVNSTMGATIRWQVYVNDTANNTAASPAYSYQTTSAGGSISVSLMSPANGGYVPDNITGFNFTATGTNATYYCELFVNGTGYGVNASVSNATPATITANTSLVDGPYIWLINCSAEGEWNSSAQRTITVDTENPQVTVNLPSGTYGTNNITLDTTVADANPTLCWYSLDGWLTNTTYDCVTTWFIAGEGVNTVWVAANDSAGNLNDSESATYTVNLTAPQVTLELPGNDTFDLDGNVTFQYHVADYNTAVLNCTLYHNITLGWQANESQMTGNDTSGTFTLNDVADGLYIWNVLCSDGVDARFAEENYTFGVDSATPDLTLDSGDIVFSDNNPGIDESVTITVTAHNLGGAASGAFDVELRVDGESIENNTLSVAAYSINNTVFQWTCGAGMHTVLIILDTTSAVAETDEGNNNASRTMTAASPSPRDERMYLSLGGGCVGEEVNISLEDEDGDEVGGADLDIYFGGSRIEGTATNSQGKAYFTPEEEGTYLVYAEKSGYIEDEEEIDIILCESCLDGILNQDESDIDCGGVCGGCADTLNCSLDDDCLSGWCLNDTCTTSTCLDGILGPDEGGVDCGGPCMPCPNCSDGIQNQDETDVDCGGVCVVCANYLSCLTDDDCLSGWCNNGVCQPTSCKDGIRGPDEGGVDCGGPCMPCHCFNGVRDEGEEGVDCGDGCLRCRTVRVVNDSETSEPGVAGVVEYHVSSLCVNQVKDPGEIDVDCGGICQPCGEGSGCGAGEDCLSGFCYGGECTLSTCLDGLLGPDEEKIDCGGPCPECPWIKADSRGYCQENLTLTVINAHRGLILNVTTPGKKVEEFEVDAEGSYYVIDYLPEEAGLYKLSLGAYDEKMVMVRNRELLPILEEIPSVVKSLFVPFILGVAGLFMWRRRRVKCVVDEDTFEKMLADNGIVDDILQEHKKLYLPRGERESAGYSKVKFVDLSDAESEAAGELSSEYGVSLSVAKALVLSSRLRAKTLITGFELPDELVDGFKGTNIKRVTLKTLNGKK